MSYYNNPTPMDYDIEFDWGPRTAPQPMLPRKPVQLELHYQDDPVYVAREEARELGQRRSA